MLAISRPFAPEQGNTEKAGLEEKCCQYLITHERPDDRPTT